MASYSNRPIDEMLDGEIDAEIAAIKKEIDSDGNDVSKYHAHFGGFRLNRLLALRHVQVRRSRRSPESA
jgi:hypothetical protein